MKANLITDSMIISYLNESNLIISNQKSEIFIISICKEDTINKEYNILLRKIMYKEDISEYRIGKILKHENSFIILDKTFYPNLTIDDTIYNYLFNKLYFRTEVLFEGAYCLFVFRNDCLYKKYCLEGARGSCEEPFYERKIIIEPKIEPKSNTIIKLKKKKKHCYSKC